MASSTQLKYFANDTLSIASHTQPHMETREGVSMWPIAQMSQWSTEFPSQRRISKFKPRLSWTWDDAPFVNWKGFWVSSRNFAIIMFIILWNSLQRIIIYNIELQLIFFSFSFDFLLLQRDASNWSKQHPRSTPFTTNWWICWTRPIMGLAMRIGRRGQWIPLQYHR